MRRGRGGFTNHKLQLYVQIVYKTQFDDSIRIFRPEKSLREDQLMPMTSIKSKLKCFVKKKIFFKSDLLWINETKNIIHNTKRYSHKR